jgi:hypothetical protein
VRNTRTILILGSGLLLGLTQASRGDWLVATDGSLIETRGPWIVKKGRVIFTQQNGHLSSIRAKEVDLERSERVTIARQRPAARAQQSEASPERPVMVITDSDIPPLSRHVLEELAAEERESEKPAAADPASEKVWETTWRKIDDPSGEGVVIMGTLQNNGRSMSDVKLTVRLFGDEGAALGEGAATLTHAALDQGEKTNFRASFPSVQEFAGVEFEIRSRP